MAQLILLLSLWFLEIDTEILKAAGQIAGIGGLAIGAFIILFREVIRKNVFPNLSRSDAYRLLRLIVILVWSIALVGIAAWVYIKTIESHPALTPNQKEYQLSGLVKGQDGGGIADVDVSVIGGVENISTGSSGKFFLLLKRERTDPVILRAVKSGYKPWEDKVGVPNNEIIIKLEPVNVNNSNQSDSAKKPMDSNQTKRRKQPVTQQKNDNQSPIIIDQRVTKPPPEN